MHRRNLALIGSLLWSVPAAAGLNIEAPATYRPGDPVTLTLTGDSEGREAPLLGALLTVDPSLDLESATAGTLSDSGMRYGQFFYWAQTALVGTCGVGPYLESNECVAVDAFSAGSINSYPLDLIPSTLSTFTFDTTDATGDILFSLDPDGAGFFGLPGTTLTIVPEPGTAALLGLGMVALEHRWRLSEVVRGMQRSAPAGRSR